MPLGSLNEPQEVIRKPSNTDIPALTMHVHAKTSALNFQHSFFHGGGGGDFENYGTLCIMEVLYE